MKRKKAKKKDSIYNSIRKPLAPPTQYHNNKVKQDKSDVVGRKKKHKEKDDE